METIQEKSTAEVGVIVGRFQTPKLHEAHLNLINTVASRHKKVLILLGNSPIKVSRRNPLDFHTRRIMVNQIFPDITVASLKDMGNDLVWSEGLDSQIRSNFDIETAVIYGSRDSFIPHYRGKFPTIKLDASNPGLSGEDIRQMVSEGVLDNEDARRGAIYAAYNRHPTAFPTVDMALWNPKTDELLVGHKKRDFVGKWRFPGGFVDPTKDRSFEDAAKRELEEETGIANAGEPIFVGSTIIDDWRYRGEIDKIFTSLWLFKSPYINAEAADDLAGLRTFRVSELIRNNGSDFMPEHVPLWDMLKTRLK